MTIAAETSFCVGAAWQPELWAEDQWDRDIARMKELGINCVRVFERAWGRFEPTEWQYDFDWAVRVLDRLRDAGIGAIVCTPTAAPPAWMITRYPEILRIHADLRRASPAQSRAASMVSSRYREFCSRIVDQMIHGFRGHEAVIGWLIDGQIGGADFSAESRRAFHTWLSERFGSIDQLNRTWGFDYGSQACEYFDQVPVPGAIVGSGPIAPERRPHPSLAINFQRFIGDQWSMYIHPQVETIRGAFDKPIGAVMTAGEWPMNWFRLNHLLDRVTVGVSCVEQTPGELLMHLDRARAEKPGKGFWVTDVAPNWQADGRVRRMQSPDALRGLAWASAMSGARGILFQNLRARGAGLGMLDGALITAAGKPAPNHETVARVSAELTAQSEWLEKHPPLEAQVAIIVSNESAWMFSIDPMQEGFDYETAWRDEFYRPLVRAHYWRDVIDQTQDYGPYKVMVAPLLPVLHQQTLDRLKKWVEEGGCLLAGPMTALRNDQGAAFTDQELGGLEALIGGTSAMRFPVQGAVVIKWEGRAEEEKGTRPHGDKETGQEEGAEAVGHQGTEGNEDVETREQGGNETEDTAARRLEGTEGERLDRVSEVSEPGAEESAVPDSTAGGWCEAFDATTAQVLARYEGGWGEGKGAVILHRLGKGTVITVGARVDPATYLDLVGALCDIAQVRPVVEGAGDVVVIPRMNEDKMIGAYGLINPGEEARGVTLPGAGVDRLTGQARGPEVLLEPGEVAIVEMETESPES